MEIIACARLLCPTGNRYGNKALTAASAAVGSGAFTQLSPCLCTCTDYPICRRTNIQLMKSETRVTHTTKQTRFAAAHPEQKITTVLFVLKETCEVWCPFKRQMMWQFCGSLNEGHILNLLVSSRLLGRRPHTSHTHTHTHTHTHEKVANNIRNYY